MVSISVASRVRTSKATLVSHRIVVHEIVAFAVNVVADFPDVCFVADLHIATLILVASMVAVEARAAVALQRKL